MKKTATEKHTERDINFAFRTTVKVAEKICRALGATPPEAEMIMPILRGILLPAFLGSRDMACASIRLYFPMVRKILDSDLNRTRAIMTAQRLGHTRRQIKQRAINLLAA